MQYKLDKGSHSVYTLQYHLVQCIKYRRKILTNDNITDFISTTIRDISQTFKVCVLDIGCDQDHFHMIFKAKPTLNIPRYLNAIKTISSREIKRKFPEIKEKLYGNHVWSPSYFLATTGQVTLDVLKQYVENQGEQ